MDSRPYQEFARTKLGFEFHDINLLVTSMNTASLRTSTTNASNF